MNYQDLVLQCVGTAISKKESLGLKYDRIHVSYTEKLDNSNYLNIHNQTHIKPKENHAKSCTKHYNQMKYTLTI